MGQIGMEAMLAQKARLEERIREAKAREARHERQREVRRKILAGSYMLGVAEGDWSKVGRELLATGLLKDDDRELFGLLPNSPEKAV